MLLLHQEMEASASPKARRRFAVHFAGSAMAEEISREGVCVCVFLGGVREGRGAGGRTTWGMEEVGSVGR